MRKYFSAPHTAHTSTHTHTYTHTHTHTNTHKHISTSTQTHILHKHINTHTHEYTHTNVHTHTHAHTCTHTHTHKHTHTRTHTHTAYMHMHTCTHAHAYHIHAPPPTDTHTHSTRQIYEGACVHHVINSQFRDSNKNRARACKRRRDKRAITPQLHSTHHSYSQRDSCCGSQTTLLFCDRFVSASQVFVVWLRKVRGFAKPTKSFTTIFDTK